LEKARTGTDCGARRAAEELPMAYEHKKTLPEISGSVFQPNPIRNCI
jgi:hypothetical protein